MSSLPIIAHNSVIISQVEKLSLRKVMPDMLKTLQLVKQVLDPNLGLFNSNTYPLFSAMCLPLSLIETFSSTTTPNFPYLKAVKAGNLPYLS